MRHFDVAVNWTVSVTHSLSQAEVDYVAQLAEDAHKKHDPSYLSAIIHYPRRVDRRSYRRGRHRDVRSIIQAEELATLSSCQQFDLGFFLRHLGLHFTSRVGCMWVSSSHCNYSQLTSVELTW